MTTVTTPQPTDRLGFLDALRGLAIAGILLVNLPDITHLGLEAAREPGLTDTLLWFGVQGRVVVIFTFLFGVSMWFVVRSARRAARRPWPALLCRLGALFGIGMLHSIAYPGDILHVYAMTGLLLIPLVLFVPRRALLVLAAAMAVGGAVFSAGFLLMTPGLMLLGYAAADAGVPRALEEGRRSVRRVLLVAALAAAPLLGWQSTAPDPRFQAAGLFAAPGLIAGAVLAVVYVCGLALLWQTRARAVIAACFVPLGRMALTNYVTASVIVVLVAPPFDFPHQTSPATGLLLALAIISVQAVVSALWLKFFRYGPLEWLWRVATWRALVPIVREREAHAPEREFAGQAHRSI